MKRLKLLISSYFLVIFSLFLYSFTQIDLSLTLSKISIWQEIQKNFQYLGFFQRPTSALIFSIILFLMFALYLSFLYLSNKNKITHKHLAILVIGSFVVLVFSYNAFSYDLFNYVFDAKILTHYHLNPYLFKPNDFPNDPMLHFMRWTQRTYPYGPTWLLLTVPLSFLGLNIFLPTVLMFKLLMGFSYLGSVYLIYKISENIFPTKKIFNALFFALNPLVLIEALVSAHNDLPMIFLLLLAINLYLSKKKILSSLSFLLSIGVKYSTVVLIPIIFYLEYLKSKNRSINWEKIFIASVLLSLIAVVLATFRTNFQPWYFLLTLSLASFVSHKRFIFVPVILLSFFSVLTYIPYVYLSDYVKGYPQVILNLQLFGLFVTIVLTLIAIYSKKIKLN